MNPSSSGWTTKYIAQITKEDTSFEYDRDLLYEQLKESGFIFGSPVSLPFSFLKQKLKLTNEEQVKLLLFHSLYQTYYFNFPNHPHKDFLTEVQNFYKKVGKRKRSLLSRLAVDKSNRASVEAFLSERVHNTPTTKKTIASLLSFSLLYIDVIVFEAFVTQDVDCKLYIEAIEAVLIFNCFQALDAKEKKSKYDNLVLELFNDSTSYLNNKNNSTFLSLWEALPTALQNNNELKKYVMDLSCLAVYEDMELDGPENKYLKTLTLQLTIEKEYAAKTISHIASIAKKNNRSLRLFQFQNPAKQFYKQTVGTVEVLIIRNKDRLLQELNESRELLVLLGQATLRDLSPEEKGKVKEQLLDICKTIPSLTIFLVPGGSLLLPLLIKFIPRLLPSAFDDNRIEKKK